MYAATKWGMNGWSESLRQQLQPDVRVIVIEPGAVATQLTDHITHRETKAAAEQMYEATAITPEDIAEIIAFAVSRPRSVSLKRDRRPPHRAGAVKNDSPQQSDTRATNPTMPPSPPWN